jgi:hypothetical protein
VIRFSAALVVVAVGVLVGGMAASSLLLVYVAIGLSVAALVALAIGVALKREEIFGEQGRASAGVVSDRPTPVGQEVNAARAGLGQERPGSAAAAGRDVFGEPFGQAARDRTTWAAAPAAPGPEIPPWQERFASSAPQQPAARTRLDPAQTRADTAQTRADLAKTRTDLTETKADPARTKADIAEAKADLTGTKADTAETKADIASGDQSAELNWFDRFASAQPADSSPDDEPVADVGPADSPAGDARAEAEAENATVENATVENATVEDTAADTAEDEEAEDEEKAETVGIDATAANTDTEDAGTEDADTEDADTEDAGIEDADTETKDTAAEAKAEDSAPAEAADSPPDGDQDLSGQRQREVTVVPGVPRYHDANCILIRFMGDDDLQRMTLDEATEAGCTPCRACTPEHEHA